MSLRKVWGRVIVVGEVGILRELKVEEAVGVFDGALAWV